MDSTIPESDRDRAARPPRARNLGFSILACRESPDYLGAWLPVQPGSWIWGRGHALASDRHPRIGAVRQRPGRNVVLPALEDPALSRAQLLVHANTPDALDVENLGRCSMRLNGCNVTQGSVRPGDIIEFGSLVALLCVQRPARLAGDFEDAHAFGQPDSHGWVGESEAAWELRRNLAFVGPRAGHVLILGDSGTGKELVASAVHALSVRSTGPFVSRNAATFPETLVDAELFGCVANFPNAGMRERKGLVASANNGTLFLDEFAELPASLQTHLLRLLDKGEYQRLGDTAVSRSSFRLIAATNRPESALRDDVRARFEFTIRVPDLLARPEDVPLLLRHLLSSMAGGDAALRSRFFDETGEARLSFDLLRTLIQSPPAGNVRGLRNLLWRALSESELDTLELPQELRDAARAPPAAGEFMRATDPERIRAALRAHEGSIELTWRALGLSNRFALMRLMKKHGIHVRKLLDSS